MENQLEDKMENETGTRTIGWLIGIQVSRKQGS